MTVDAWTKTAGSDGDLNAISRLISVLVSKLAEWLDSVRYYENKTVHYTGNQSSALFRMKVV